MINATDSIQQLYKLLAKGGKVLISDPMTNEADKSRIIDDFMRVKKDGHIQFYSASELERLFVDNGFVLEKQVITEMKFPFAQNEEYIEVFDKTSSEDRALYDIVNENSIIWVKHINVGNTIFVKE